jgi:hypothetical protein
MFEPSGLTVQLVIFPLQIVTLISTVTCTPPVFVTVRLVLPVVFVGTVAELFPVIVTIA